MRARKDSFIDKFGIAKGRFRAISAELRFSPVRAGGVVNAELEVVVTQFRNVCSYD
jgi:hypothetical protein